MKNLLIFVAFVGQSLLAFGQQVNIDPATANESVAVECVLPTGGASGDLMVFGHKSDFYQKAFVARVSSSGALLWSKNSEELSSFSGANVLPNGNFVAVGYQWNDAMVAVFDPNGVPLWNKVFYTDTVESFNSVTSDPSGNIYIAGQKGASSGNVSRDILLKLDGLGNVLWSTQVLTQSNPGSNRKIHLANGSLFVVGSVDYNAKDISVSCFDSGTGSLLAYRAFGSFSSEVFLDAVFDTDALYFTFATQGTDLSVGKVSLTTLNLDFQPNTFYSLDVSVFTRGKISLGTDGVYVSGGATGVGFKKAFAAKLSHNLNPIWGKLITPSSTPSSEVFGNASLVLPSGDIVFSDWVEKSDFTLRSVLTQLSSLGNPNGVYCQTPSNFQFEMLSGWFYQNTLSRSQMSLSFSEAVDVFGVYTPSIQNCAVIILPVELVSFTGEKQGEQSVLRWQTASERQTSHFKVLRLEDDGWKEIGRVEAAGESQQLIDYIFVDENPLTGDNYYRLEMVDQDDSTEPSEVVVVRFDSDRENFSVFPNPAKAGDWITVKGEFQAVEVSDQMGRQVSFQRNGNQLVLQAGPGMYLLNFVDADGVPQTVRIVTN
ncbi:MAG: T9SS type A sorting domain-containing protein [Candidatus Paceibacterota bacterium]